MKQECDNCDKNISTEIRMRVCAKAAEDNGVFGDCGDVDEIESISKVECAECHEKRKKKEEDENK